MDVEAIFSPTVALLELFLRGTVTFLVLLAMQRLVGQREVGGLGMNDLLVIVLIAQAIGPGLMGASSSIADGLILAATILLWSVVLDAIGYRWPKVGAILKGRPHAIVLDGRADHRALRREFLSMDELMSQLRLQGIENIAEVRRAYIEPNGEISILRTVRSPGDSPA